ncbi:hypothetical protein [Primorskyibacter flagellatus]|uniref:hypothetical protein n=1 Tax=Primorskyibacter flagellatus TaxID=1387277 RepID=UPI003A8CFBD8
MEALENLLQLPYQTLAILVAGYLSYRLAYTGRDPTHKTLDTLAIALVFAFVAQAASAGFLTFYNWKYPAPSGSELPLWLGYSASVGGIVVALLAAGAWRKLNNKALPWTLRKLRISSADRYHAAWESVIANEDSGPSSITIVKKDGAKLMSEKLADFENAPFGPAILGSDGSVAIYVTHFKDVDAEDWESNEVDYADWGPEITVIPASEIAEIRIRHSRKPSILRMWGRKKTDDSTNGAE